MSVFKEKKGKILQDLARPDDEYNDLSPKGSVDEQIRELVEDINKCDGYVTTSSCAGRIAVFLEGLPKSSIAEHTDSTDSSSASTQGKGGGRWLYISHDPIDMSEMQHQGAIQSLLGLPSDTPIAGPPNEQRPRFVHLKFEPMVSRLSSLSSLTSKPLISLPIRFCIF